MNKIQPIQTLRGIAVILVVLGHWGLFFDSGFIGVDIFFVISGYVVTLVSLRKAQDNAFKAPEFLKARFLRLFPALGGMVFVVFAFQLIYYPRFEWARAAEEGIWSILWVSNAFSHVRLGDYFGETAGTSLLLHTWSLSVEFQAYIALALLYFWTLAKNKNVRHLQVALSVMTVSSLVVALASQFDSPNNLWQAVSSYYSPLTRFYQIGVGALLATLTVATVKSRQRYLVIGVFLVVGIALVPEGLFSWNLMGFGAVIGATLFIFFVKSRLRAGLVERILASVGNYSYSIYLWHWPVLVVVQSLVPGAIEQVVIGAGLTTLLSILSYRFLELPFMGSTSRVLENRQKVVSVFGKATALLLVLSAALYASSPIKPTDFDSIEGVLKGDTTQVGFAESFNEIVQPCSDATAEFSENVGAVFNCYETSNSDQIDILVLGNSHAAHLIPGVVSSNPNVKLRYLPIRGGFHAGNSELQKALDYWVSSGSVADYLYVNSFWEIEQIDKEEILRAISVTGVSQSRTFVFDDVPQFKISPVRCKYSVMFPIPAPCQEKLSNFAQHISDFHSSVKDKLPLVNLVYSSGFFTKGSDIYFLAEGQSILFRDQNHLNELGSKALIGWLIESQALSTVE